MIKTSSFVNRNDAANTGIIALYIPFDGLWHIIRVYALACVPLTYIFCVISMASSSETLIGNTNWMFASVCESRMLRTIKYLMTTKNYLQTCTSLSPCQFHSHIF